MAEPAVHKHTAAQTTVIEAAGSKNRWLRAAVAWVPEAQDLL